MLRFRVLLCDDYHLPVQLKTLRIIISPFTTSTAMIIWVNRGIVGVSGSRTSETQREFLPLVY